LLLSFQIYFASFVPNLFCWSAKFILLECKIYFAGVQNLFCFCLIDNDPFFGNAPNSNDKDCKKGYTILVI